MFARGPAHALTVIAARGADDFGGQGVALGELFKVGQSAANLERADGVVVLVLEPAIGAESFGQQGPAVLRRGLKFFVHRARGGFDVGKRGQRLCAGFR